MCQHKNSDVISKEFSAKCDSMTITQEHAYVQPQAVINPGSFDSTVFAIPQLIKEDIRDFCATKCVAKTTEVHIVLEASSLDGDWQGWFPVKAAGRI